MRTVYVAAVRWVVNVLELLDVRLAERQLRRDREMLDRVRVVLAEYADKPPRRLARLVRYLYGRDAERLPQRIAHNEVFLSETRNGN